LVTRIETATASDELQIVHNEQREPFVAFQSTGFGANFEHAGRARIIDPQRGGSNSAQRFGHALPVFSTEMPAAEFVSINLRDGSHQALQQRFLGHFQAEHGHRQSSTDGDILGEIQGQGGFALRGPGREDNQLRRLQAGEQLVELAVARGDAGDALPFPEDSFQAIKALVNNILDGEQAGFDAIFSQRKDAGFRVVKDGVSAIFAFESALLDIVGGVNQVAENRLFFDDARIVLHVGDTRHAVHQGSKVRSAASRFQFALAMQLLGQRDQVDGLLRFAQGDHVFEDLAVLRQEEILCFQRLNGRVQYMVIEEDSAENGALCVEVTGKRAFESGVGRHGSAIYTISI
jgi:hypothetical protein